MARFSDIISYFISIARTFSLDALRNKFQVVSIKMNRKDVMAIAYWMGFMFLEKSFRVNFKNVFFFESISHVRENLLFPDGVGN